jgi:hypothetical membrane protein
MTPRTGPRREVFIRLSPILGIAGSILIAAVVTIVASLYTGARGERYSLLNHFISELGQLGVSRAAWLFNAGLIVSGVLFIPYTIGLGMRIRGIWAYLGMATGIGAGVFCAAVGVFPMNRQAMHVFVAMWFFRFGLLTTLLFAVAILSAPREKARVVRSASVFSFIAVAAYAGFLVLAGVPHAGGGNPLDPSSYAHRPDFWLLAVLEWSVFFATILWFLGVAVLVSARARGSATPSGRATAPRRRA